MVNTHERIGGKNILLMDDVFTNRARANEAAKNLNNAVEGKVCVFTLGRVVVGKVLGR